MVKKRLIIFLSVILGIALIAYFLIKLASGYRPDFSTKTMRPTGLLVATSNPNQASILVNGKMLKVKTATTLSLAPGEYDIEIKKDGFSSWKKKILIEKELVAKTDAYLFPTYPDLKALTSMSASNPVISPDGKKVVFAVANQDEKNGLWILDLTERPLGLARESYQIIQSAPKGRNFAQAGCQWSPDSKQILITLVKIKATTKTKAVEENFLIDANNLNDNTKLIDVTDQLLTIQKGWKNEEKILEEAKLGKLPEELSQILDKGAKEITFSLDETKVLYTATASASIPKNLIPPLPGANNQPETRDLTSGRTYVYDLKEDRNFALDLPQEAKVSWFPTSRHLFLVQKDKISIKEYDNTNHLDVYSGPFENSFAFPFPSGNKILVLTSLSKETPSNLYSISLK
ncbi:MAG: PEGA domain-containing protein [Candidatus Shapirobacteria bacterium]|nr:PEGA domain-containing protein [Candidatus Shapirobacteria bacterium]